MRVDWVQGATVFSSLAQPVPDCWQVVGYSWLATRVFAHLPRFYSICVLFRNTAALIVFPFLDGHLG